LADVQADYRQAAETEREQAEIYANFKKAANLNLNRAQLVTVKASIKTEKDAKELVAAEELERQIAAHNTFLAEQNRYGLIYAALNQVMHSQILQGSSQAFGELAQLQQSSSEELKAIGKASALFQIGIKTYESAMNIYAGFSTIPILGPILGIAGAAAAIAFGVEQASKVVAMAHGGMVTGGVPGSDSVPTMLAPGELVTPAQNYDEHINAMVAARGGAAAAGQTIRVIVEMKGNASRMLQVQAVQDRAMGTYRGT
jgi:hypothetical protein